MKIIRKKYIDQNKFNIEEYTLDPEMNLYLKELRNRNKSDLAETIMLLSTSIMNLSILIYFFFKFKF